MSNPFLKTGQLLPDLVEFVEQSFVTSLMDASPQQLFEVAQRIGEMPADSQLRALFIDQILRRYKRTHTIEKRVIRALCPEVSGAWQVIFVFTEDQPAMLVGMNDSYDKIANAITKRFGPLADRHYPWLNGPSANS